jgi:hypothetical protein
MMAYVRMGFWEIVGVRLLFNRFTVVVGLTAAACATWSVIRTPQNPTADMRETLLDLAAQQLAAQASHLEGRSVVLAQLGGDPSGTLTEGLRQRLSIDGVRTIPEELLRVVLAQIGWRGRPVVALSDAVRLGREAGVSSVLFGEVTDYRLGDRAGRLRLELRWAETSTGKASYGGPVEAAIGDASDYWSARAGRAPVWPRLLIWLAVSLFLPVVCVPIIERLTALDSNATNFALLAALTAIDTLLAATLLGFRFSGALPALALILAFGIAGIYNFAVVGWIDQYRS